MFKEYIYPTITKNSFLEKQTAINKDLAIIDSNTQEGLPLYAVCILYYLKAIPFYINKGLYTKIMYIHHIWLVVALLQEHQL